MTIFWKFIITMPKESKSSGHEKEYVVLLHGLRRTSLSMRKIEKYLATIGYKIINQSYPSASKPIEQLTREYIGEAIIRCKNQHAEKIHFVTHSMGGILIRQYLQKHSLPRGSRIVMLAPPNGGSDVVDSLKRFFLFKWYYGPAGQELGTNSGSMPNRLKPVDVEVGIIAGRISLNPLTSLLILGPNDGKVSMERTKLKEMTDFFVVPASHTLIMRNPIALKQIAYFLQHGLFDRNTVFKK